MERKLTLTFGLLLLRRQHLVSLLVDTLSEKLLDTLSGEDVLEGELSLFDETAPESAQTQLNDSSVVKDLSSDVGRVNGLLQVRHQEHVSCGVELVMQGVVEDMGEHRTSTQE